jgi:hypothetical protein
MQKYLSILAFIIPMYSFAQLPSQRGYFEDEAKKEKSIEVERISAYGIYAGLNGSGIAGSQSSQLQFRGFNRIGVSLGGYYNVPLSDHFDFQMEVMFIQKGARESIPDDPAAAAASNNGRIAMNTIEVPIGVRRHIFLADNVQSLANHISVDLMIAPGFVVYQAQKDRQTDWTPTNFNNFHINSIFGVNYHLNEKIMLGFRWNNSITPVQRIDVPSGTATLFQQVFGTGARSQTLGIKFFYQI